MTQTHDPMTKAREIAARNRRVALEAQAASRRVYPVTQGTLEVQLDTPPGLGVLVTLWSSTKTHKGTQVSHDWYLNPRDPRLTEGYQPKDPQGLADDMNKYLGWT